jgi:hypothetical protein
MELDGPQFPELAPIGRRIAPIVVAVVIACGGIVYAVHEHNGVQVMAAQKQALAAQNAQVTAQLSATQSQLAALADKVNALTSSSQPNPAASNAPTRTATATGRRPSAAHRAPDPRFQKLQSQLDAQGKAIYQERSDLESTRNDLTSARTELTGSIARTHDELVVLEKKGERSYFEFDLTKSKDFKREGPLSISLRKADTKHGFADLSLIVEDRTLSQKHVNLYQPAMFYEPDNMQPVEIVINDLSKNHVHGYVSAPKYRKSELDVASDAAANPGAAGTQPAPRQRLPLPGDSNQQ